LSKTDKQQRHVTLNMFKLKKHFEKNNYPIFEFSKNETKDLLNIIVKKKSIDNTKKYSENCYLYFGIYYNLQQNLSDAMSNFDKFLELTKNDEVLISYLEKNNLDFYLERYLEQSSNKLNKKSLVKYAKFLRKEKEYVKMEEKLLLASELGSEDALIELADYYKDDIDISMIYKKMLADKGNIDYIIQVGKYYENYENYWDSSIYYSMGAIKKNLFCVDRMIKHCLYNELDDLNHFLKLGLEVNSIYAKQNIINIQKTLENPDLNLVRKVLLEMKADNLETKKYRDHDIFRFLVKHKQFDVIKKLCTPLDKNNYYFLGKYYYEPQGKYEKAIEFFEKYNEEINSLIVIEEILAIIKDKLGDITRFENICLDHIKFNNEKVCMVSKFHLF